MGTFQKQYEGRLHKPNTNGTIIKNAIKISISNEVCGLGLNPNTGEKIQDISSGYIDANGSFCFPNENVDLTFGSKKSIEQGFGR